MCHARRTAFRGRTKILRHNMFYFLGMSYLRASLVRLGGKKSRKSKAAAFTELHIKPKLTFVCVGKGHHIRFFGDRQNVDKSGNCLPGTVVDQGITHPAIWDFYLQSHPGLKGTSSPSHYTVLYDEMDCTADKLQSISHALCHIYARSTCSVSIPAPVYYADVWNIISTARLKR
ncbi:unnamed protein product [Rhizoctonia solani]|nr:unnamed protein product [Rhizoctonia solani]